MSPKSATTDHQIEAIHHMGMNDRPVTVQHIADTICISVGSVQIALTYVLGMSKLSASWVCHGQKAEKTGHFENTFRLFSG